MSQWTHVAGIIRLDNMGANIVRQMPTGSKRERIEEAVTKALGSTCDYESDQEAWERCSVPRGSEGSLQHNVFPNSDEEDSHALSWGYATIWGDLRDFGTEDVPKIKNWFQKSLERLQKPDGFKSPKEMTMLEKAEYMLSTFIIRDAVLSVNVEYQSALILLWDGELKKVIEFRG